MGPYGADAKDWSTETRRNGFVFYPTRGHIEEGWDLLVELRKNEL